VKHKQQHSYRIRFSQNDDKSPKDVDSNPEEQSRASKSDYVKRVWQAFKQPAMILLFLAAAIRHTGIVLYIAENIPFY
jgi:hypothetical protein